MEKIPTMADADATGPDSREQNPSKTSLLGIQVPLIILRPSADRHLHFLGGGLEDGWSTPRPGFAGFLVLRGRRPVSLYLDESR
jgi:hypothetical protein